LGANFVCDKHLDWCLKLHCAHYFQILKQSPRLIPQIQHQSPKQFVVSTKLCFQYLLLRHLVIGMYLLKARKRFSQIEKQFLNFKFENLSYYFLTFLNQKLLVLYKTFKFSRIIYPKNFQKLVVLKFLKTIVFLFCFFVFLIYLKFDIE